MIDYRLLIAEFRNNRALTISFVALIVGAQAWQIVPYMAVDDVEPDYYYWVLPNVKFCDPFQLPQIDGGISRNPLKWWANCASFQWFGSPKVIPLIFNIGVMPLVYVLGSYMTGNRVIGLVALLAFIWNPLYSDWKTNGTYDQVWSFFLLLSVILMYRTRFSGASFLASILGKSMAVLYFPAWLYTSYSIRKKSRELVIMGIVVSAGFALSFMFVNVFGTPIEFHPERWEDAVFRNISVLWQVIPFLALFVVLKVNFTPKNGAVQNMRTVWAWIGMALIQNPLVYFFSLQDTYSYRYVPLAAFMSVFIGMVLVNMGNWIVEQKLRRAKLPSI